MTESLSEAGLVGKLPTHGDFVARGVGAAERSAIDDWLAGEVAAARDSFGTAYEGLYDQAPPCRFHIRSAGEAQAGALIASMDRVGRRFPLMLWTASPDRATAATVELLAYDALAEAWDADCLYRELQAQIVSSGHAAGTAVEAHWWIEDSEGMTVATLTGGRPTGIIAEMLRWAGAAPEASGEERRDAL